MPRRSLRSGLRIRGHRGHPAVRAAFLRYASWLRTEIEFPLRVPVYLLPGKRVRTVDGQFASASIFLPWSRRADIRVATGDYDELRRARGRDNALAAYLSSLSHEVVHYRQWVETGRSWEQGVITKAKRLVERYAQTVDHP